MARYRKPRILGYAVDFHVSHLDGSRRRYFRDRRNLSAFLCSISDALTPYAHINEQPVYSDWPPAALAAISWRD